MQAAEELLQEGFRAVETITAQRQELDSLYQQVQLLQQQLANFCNAVQYAELQAAAITPLAKVIVSQLCSGCATTVLLSELHCVAV